jgi:hypothetical protein
LGSVIAKNKETKEEKFHKILPVQQENHEVPLEIFQRKFMISKIWFTVMSNLRS